MFRLSKKYTQACTFNAYNCMMCAHLKQISKISFNKITYLLARTKLIKQLTCLISITCLSLFEPESLKKPN